MLIGRCVPTTISALVKVPLTTRNGGPCDDDHLKPLVVLGSNWRVAKSSITEPRPVRSRASCAFRSVRFTPSSVEGKSATDLTLPTIAPYSSRLTVVGAMRISMPCCTFFPSLAGMKITARRLALRSSRLITRVPA